MHYDHYMSTTPPTITAPIEWTPEPHGKYAYTPDLELFVYKDGDGNGWDWSLWHLGLGETIVTGNKPYEACATAEAISAYVKRVPDSYFVRSYRLMPGSDRRPQDPFGPFLDQVTLEEANRAAIEYTETHHGSLIEILDPQGRVLVDFVDGVSATP